MKQHVPVKVERMQVISVNEGVKPYNQYAVRIPESFIGMRYLSPTKARRVAIAVERAINHALKTT